MSTEEIEAIRQYRKDVRSGDEMRDPSHESHIIDSLLDEVDRLGLARFNEAEETQHPPLRASSPAAELPAHGGTANPAKGSITRETLPATSLFNNTAPWVATCGWCSKNEEVGMGTITLPQSMTDRGWTNSIQFGWICPKCKPAILPALT